MTRSQEKKEIEQPSAGGSAESWSAHSDGELAGEEPDFTFHTPTRMLGIEVSKVLRPASTDEGILPAEAEAFHQSIMLKAQDTYQETNGPTQVSVDFSRARRKKRDKPLDKGARRLRGAELPPGQPWFRFDEPASTAD